jgi:perosamine synthetase
MKHKTAYINRIADWLKVQPGQIETFWKGRVGLYALLKAFGVSEGDEVILPAFTCVVVPNAIIYCGAQPVYVDITAETLNTDFDKVKAAVTEKTKVILVQNTFGLSNEVDKIAAFAREKNILTIEDCTHGFGGKFNDAPNGSFCDAAFYSTQWNKPFSTGIGGFAVLNNSSYRDAFNQVNSQLETPTRKDRYMLATLIQARKYLLHDSTYWTALRLYRSMSKSGLVVGSSKGEELIDSKMPKNYFLRGVKVQEKVGEKALWELPEILALRNKNGLAYNTFMRENGKWSYSDRDLSNHAFLNYPVFVDDKKVFQSAAEKAKIRLGDWFVSPIHPVLEDFDRWQIEPKKYPVAYEKSHYILNLPTDVKDSTVVLRFLENHLHALR